MKFQIIVNRFTIDADYDIILPDTGTVKRGPFLKRPYENSRFIFFYSDQPASPRKKSIHASTAVPINNMLVSALLNSDVKILFFIFFRQSILFSSRPLFKNVTIKSSIQPETGNYHAVLGII
jgi:hypothetical protein